MITISVLTILFIGWILSSASAIFGYVLCGIMCLNRDKSEIKFYVEEAEKYKRLCETEKSNGTHLVTSYQETTDTRDLLLELASELGLMEWASAEHAEKLLHGVIAKYHTRIRNAAEMMSRPESPVEEKLRPYQKAMLDKIKKGEPSNCPECGIEFPFAHKPDCSIGEAYR